MTTHFHVIVWIDHSKARVFGIGREDAEGQVIRTHAHQRQVHHKANSRDSGHAPPDHEFFERVAQSVQDAGALLIVGPASAKTEFMTYLGEKHPPLAKRVSAVEPLDHPGDGELISLARRFFRVDDLVRGAPFEASRAHGGPAWRRP
jgi:stalled ribosome rescue protein Dom34